MWNAVRKIKIKKTVGQDGIPVDVWKSLDNLGIGWVKKIFNKILIEGKVSVGRGERRAVCYQYLRVKVVYKKMGTI